MGRTLRLGLAGGVLALCACNDMGVRGAADLPLAVARTRPPVYWSYQAVTPQTRQPYEGRTGDLFTLGTQRFIVEFPDVAGPSSWLTQIGSAAGAPVLAPRWAQPPYEQVYLSPGHDRLQVAKKVWQ